MAVHNFFLGLQNSARNCTVAQLFTEMSLDLSGRGKETEALNPKETPVTHPRTMLSLCWNLALVDIFQRFVAFTFHLFPCAGLSNLVLEVPML